MAPRPPEQARPQGTPVRAPQGPGAPGDPGSPGDPVTAYLQEQAAAFLRALRARRESGTSAPETEAAVHALRGAAHRVEATLHTFRPLLEAEWAEHLQGELNWLSAVLGSEYACAHRLGRLLGALRRLRDEEGARAAAVPAQGHPEGPLPMGAARAGALLDRQLTLARNRAHSAALDALGSARFHAVADAVAVLASEVPYRRGASPHDPEVIGALASLTSHRLADAIAALPLDRAGAPYNAEASALGSAAPGGEPQDAPWHRVRGLLRVRVYAAEALGAAPEARTAPGARALDRHREAADAATAAAAAARTPRIAPPTAYALGVLHAVQRQEVEAARHTFQRVWREAVRV
ncbi:MULTISPECIES: CHAD domain-containing protein [unclassified Streptomyces]|nr:CHAD domain-containing protein [Streptomyces sp. LcepLS]MYR25888.1 CHAD domain-containing protein [Streptomyces sp. SID4945]SCE90596.1 CHAD domain-containing protein [Streptomyces sp. LcepLS]